MSGLFSSPKAAQQEAPEKIAQAGPTGSTQFGNFDEQGNFVVDPSIITQLTTESPFGQEFREGREQLSLGLLGGLSPQLTDPRSAQQIRGILPSAQGTTEGLGGFATPESIRGGIQTSLPGDFAGEGQRLEDATFGKFENLVGGSFDEQRENLAQSLANQGIPIGSEAFEREFSRLEDSQGRLRESAAFESIGAGRSEQERLSRLALSTRGQEFGEGFGLAGLASQNRAQQFGENRSQLQDALQKQLALASLEQQQRAQQFGELGSLGGFSLPFSPTPISSLAGSSTGAQAAGPGFQLLGQLGGAALAASDRDLKENIELVDETNGFNIYEFNYKTDPEHRYRGVMAQEVQKTRPDAVVKIDGYLAVMYDLIGVKMEAV